MFIPPSARLLSRLPVMVEFVDVILTAGKQRKRGSLSFTSTSAPTLDFQPRTSTSKVRIALSDVASLSWWQQFDGFVLRVEMRGGTTVKFSGLKEDAWQHLTQLAKQHTLPINKQHLSTKGTNAQQLHVTGQQPLTSQPASQQPLTTHSNTPHTYATRIRGCRECGHSSPDSPRCQSSERGIHMMSESSHRHHCPLHRALQSGAAK